MEPCVVSAAHSAADSPCPFCPITAQRYSYGQQTVCVCVLECQGIVEEQKDGPR